MEKTIKSQKFDFPDLKVGQGHTSKMQALPIVLRNVKLKFNPKRRL